MNKKPIIIVSILGAFILVVGIIILSMNNIIKNKNKLVIIDATYSCVKQAEKFFEDDKYIYSFPCVNSSRSIYVKFENGNKMLVVDALENEKVTIDELIKAGLEVYKQEK